ncbi:hypothetical protein EXIGLDRAFT_582417, partial [Exidia glandulosa HHB12029]
DKGAVYDETEESALLALYSTIASDGLQARHVKPDASSRDVWKSLCAEFEGNNRSQRMQLKRALYMPVHDPSVSIIDYIHGVVSASDRLAALECAVKEHDIVDSLIMNLDDSWSIVRTILTSQATEPKLEAVKATLISHEQNTMARDEYSADAHAVRSGGRRHRSRSTSRSRTRSGGFDWLNTKERDVCHRCGRPGHRSSRC